MFSPFSNVIFGDQGYYNEGHLLSPFPGVMLDEDEQFFNNSMLEPRLTVEWGFMRVSQLFQAFNKPYLTNLIDWMVLAKFLIASAVWSRGDSFWGSGSIRVGVQIIRPASLSSRIRRAFARPASWNMSDI